MSKVLTDLKTLVEARAHRKELCDYRLPEWAPEIKGRLPQYEHLRRILKSRNREFMFYAENDVNADETKGVEEHVLLGLKKLVGPHGYTYYRALLAQKEKA